MNRVNAQKTGQLIRQQRTTIGMTQRMLADDLNVTDKAISKWENGDGLPDISILIQLAAKLQITTDELLAGRTNKVKDICSVHEQKDNQNTTNTNKKPALEDTQFKLVYLILSICLSFYLALNQITGQFSSWFTNQFIIDNELSTSIITALPGLLLNQLFLVSLLLMLLRIIMHKFGHPETSRLLSIIIFTSGFFISLINLWFGTTGLMFEYGSHLLIGLTLLLTFWMNNVFILRVFSGLTGLSVIGEFTAHIFLLTSQNVSIGVRFAVLPLIINRGIMLFLWVFIYMAIIKEKDNLKKTQRIEEST